MGGRGASSTTARAGRAGKFDGGGQGTDLPTDGLTPLDENGRAKVSYSLDAIEHIYTKGLDHEQLHIVDAKTGMIISAVDGGKRSVGITPNAMTNIKNNIVTHNHPSGNAAFSSADIWTLSLGMKEVRASAVNGISSIRKTGNKQNVNGLGNAYQKNLGRLHSLGSRNANKIKRKNYKTNEDHQKAVDLTKSAPSRNWLQSNAGKYGFKFSFTSAEK